MRWGHGSPFFTGACHGRGTEGHAMLTDAKARQAQPREKDYKISDSGGLLLFVAKSGRKTWRFKYRSGGKERRIVFGAYPDMKLSEARARRDKAKEALREGRDPSIEMRKRALTNRRLAEATFEKHAREWWKAREPRWKPVHAKDVITSLERDVFPDLGNFPLHEIDSRVLLQVLRKVEDRGAIETARRLRQRVDRIYRFAKATGAFSGENPATDVGEAMKELPKSKRWPSLGKVDDLRGLIAKVDLSRSYPVTRLASRFLALTAQRPGMVRRMLWSHLEGIDWDRAPERSTEAIWHIPSDEMKVEFDKRGDDEWDHDVPLAPQAVEVLQTVRTLTGDLDHVFPHCWNPLVPMTENALSSLYRRLGYAGRHVPHGWRGSFSTIMNERLERRLGSDERHMIDRLIIDLMLAHLPTGMSGDEFAYNRAKFMARRREIAREWADLITEGAAPLSALTEGKRRRVR